MKDSWLAREINQAKAAWADEQAAREAAITGRPVVYPTPEGAALVLLAVKDEEK